MGRILRKETVGKEKRQINTLKDRNNVNKHIDKRKEKTTATTKRKKKEKKTNKRKQSKTKKNPAFKLYFCFSVYIQTFLYFAFGRSINHTCSSRVNLLLYYEY